MTRSKEIRCVGIAIALLLVTSTVAQNAPASNAAIDEVLRSAVADQHLPCVVALVARGDAIVYQGAFGKQNDAAAATVPTDAIFRIASMTKTVTTVALMQLVERGKVKLDEPASTYVPEVARVQVLDGFDESGKPKLRPPKSAITIRQLLTHTSGFAYEFLDAKLTRYVATGAIPSTMGPGEEWMKAPLMFDPGTAWEYGVSIDWIGKVVERVSGLSLDDYFRQYIFAPLGMNDSFFNVPLDKQRRVVTLHQRKQDGTLAESPNQFKPVRFFSAGGGLYSTAGDYLQFTRMLLAGGTLGKATLLRPETVATMRRNQIGDLSLVELKSQIPQLFRAGAAIPGSLDKFGFGFAINTQAVPGGRGAGSMAWAGLFNTFYWIDPERKTTAVLMMQLLPFVDELPQKLLENFERAVYAATASKAAR